MSRTVRGRKCSAECYMSTSATGEQENTRAGEQESSCGQDEQPNTCLDKMTRRKVYREPA
jgi:hypothetical protein